MRNYQKNEAALQLVSSEISKMVQSFDDQTDDMKTQSMTIHYRVWEEPEWERRRLKNINTSICLNKDI